MSFFFAPLCSAWSPPHPASFVLVNSSRRYENCSATAKGTQFLIRLAKISRKTFQLFSQATPPLVPPSPVRIKTCEMRVKPEHALCKVVCKRMTNVNVVPIPVSCCEKIFWVKLCLRNCIQGKFQIHPQGGEEIKVIENTFWNLGWESEVMQGGKMIYNRYSSNSTDFVYDHLSIQHLNRTISIESVI